MDADAELTALRASTGTSSNKPSVEDDARKRARQTLLDGNPIMDRALLLRCVEEFEHLRAALQDIIANGQSRGGIWARQRAQEALEPRNLLCSSRAAGPRLKLEQRISK